MYRNYIKRIFDIFISVIALFVLLPLVLIIALLILIKLGMPILFMQRRAGKNGKTYIIYKFRSLTSEKDENGKLLPNEQRLTKFGSFLRATGLDELPELFNILKGDMSVIGPRSLPTEYLPYYTEIERHRHDVRGGLIPPEVLYNNIMPDWEKQFEYEVHYASHVSFLLDMKILFCSIKGLFSRKKANYGSYVRQPLYEERFK